MGYPTSGERANRRRRRPSHTGKTPRAAATVVFRAVRRRTHAVKPHDLVPVGDATGILLVGRASHGGLGLDHFAILFKPGHRLGAVLDLEDHLDPTRKCLGGPAGVEDYLDDAPGMVALRQLGERRKDEIVGPNETRRNAGSGAGAGTGSGFRFGDSGKRFFVRRRGFGLLVLGFGGFDDVFEALNALPATGTGD